MNEIKLRGYIRDIQYSHSINGVDYDKANLVVPNPHSKDDDIVTLCFKHHSNKYSEGDLVDVIGNVRSYSQKISENRNKVTIYVFTYFDFPNPEDSEFGNDVELDGRICKIDHLRNHTSGIDSLSFTLANNIILPEGRGKINNYIPVVCWGKLAHELSKCNVSDKIKIKGFLHSRIYKKQISEETIDFRTAHEVVLKEYELL